MTWTSSAAWQIRLGGGRSEKAKHAHKISPHFLVRTEITLLASTSSPFADPLFARQTQFTIHSIHSSVTAQGLLASQLYR